MSDETRETVAEEETEAETTETQETETQEETTEQETTEEEQESTEETKPQKSDSVPLSKYMQEKKRRQELEKQLAADRAEREKLRLKEEFVQRGWPEQEAEYQAAEKVRQQENERKLQDKLTDIEIKDLAKSDSFYADAETFKDDLKEKMRELNCDAETAYMLIRGKARTKEMQIEREATAQARRKSASAKKTESAAPSSPKNPYPLDDHDKKALAELQKVQPDAGWTVEKYHKLMKT